MRQAGRANAERIFKRNQGVGLLASVDTHRQALAHKLLEGCDKVGGWEGFLISVKINKSPVLFGDCQKDIADGVDASRTILTVNAAFYFELYAQPCGKF